MSARYCTPFIAILSLFLPLAALAGSVVIQPLPRLEFAGNASLPTEKVRDIILGGMDASSARGLTWSVDSEEPGLLVAKMEFRTHHARVNIHYTARGIHVVFKDSNNLDQQDLGDGLVAIHPNYQRRMDIFFTRLKKAGKMIGGKDLLDASVITPDSGPASNASPVIVVAAMADTGNTLNVRSETRTVGRFSERVSRLMVSTLEEKTPATASVRYFPWGRDAKRLATKGRNEAVANATCQEHKADKLFFATAAPHRELPYGIVTYYFHDCKTGQAMHDTSNVEFSRFDSFAFEVNLKKTLVKFIKDNKLLQ